MRATHSAMRINKTMKKKYAGAPRCLPWGDPGTRNDADASQRCCGQIEQEPLPADVRDECRPTYVRLRQPWRWQPLPPYVHSGRKTQEALLDTRRELRLQNTVCERWKGEVYVPVLRRVLAVPTFMRDECSQTKKVLHTTRWIVAMSPGLPPRRQGQAVLPGTWGRWPLQSTM